MDFADREIQIENDTEMSSKNYRRRLKTYEFHSSGLYHEHFWAQKCSP